MHRTTWRSVRDFNTYIVFGMVIKEKVESISYNGAVCIGPEGDVVTEYRKVHLLGEERQVYRNGFRFSTVEAECGTFWADDRNRSGLSRGGVASLLTARN